MKFIAYLRVSSKNQTDNNSFNIQLKEVTKFAEGRAGQILEVIKETVSGAKTDRKGLSLAIELCKKHEATLLIAKLDRLTRETSLLEVLEKSKIKFICANMPEANELVIGMLSVVAKFEKKQINERTKKGQQAVIQKYGKLHWKTGSNTEFFSEQGRKKGAQRNKEKSAENINNRHSKAFAKSLQSQNYKPSQILKELQVNKYKTATGLDFSAISQVQRLLK